MKVRTATFNQKLKRAMEKHGIRPEPGRTARDNMLAAHNPTKRPGPKTKPPQPYVKVRPDGSAMVYVRDDGHRESLDIVVREDVDEQLLAIAVDIAMQTYQERKEREQDEQASPEDVTLREIHRRWREAMRNTSSAQVNYNRELYERHLFAHRSDMRLRDLHYDFGLKYIAQRIGHMPDGGAKDSAHDYAVSHLEDFARALALHNRGVHTDLIRHFFIPDKKRRVFAFHLTWDLLVRLLLVARGWVWDKEKDRWGRRWNETTGRWTLLYDRSLRDDALVRFICLYAFSGTRDSTIPLLSWSAGGTIEGTIIAKDGIIVRRPPGHVRTNKRAEPAYLIGPLPNLTKSWLHDDVLTLCPHVIHDKAGKRLNDMRTRFNGAADRAGIPWVTPHHCKHTGATLYSYGGLPIEDLADAFSTEAGTLRKNYIHLQHLWRKPLRKQLKPTDLSLLKLRRVMPASGSEWLKEAARLKAEHEEKQKAPRLRPVAEAEISTVEPA